MFKKCTFFVLIYLACLCSSAPVAQAQSSALDQSVLDQPALDQPALELSAVSVAESDARDLPSGLHVIESSANQIIIEWRAPTYSWQPNHYVSSAATVEECVQPHMDGYPSIGKVGAPQLPVKVSMLGIPPKAEITWSITANESITQPVDALICPGPRAVVKGAADEEDPHNRWDGSAWSMANSNHAVRYVEEPSRVDAQVYEKDELYPSQSVQIEEIGAMRSQHLARLELTPIQYNPVKSTLVHHKRMQIVINFGESAPQGAAIVENNEFEMALASSLLNYETARSWRSLPPQAASSPWVPPENSYRIQTGESGIYAVTYDALMEAGFPVTDVSPADLRVYYKGIEIAIDVQGAEDNSFDSGDVILFYAEPVDERFTSSGFYWISTETEHSQAPKRMAIENGGRITTLPNVTHHVASVYHEANLQYVSSLPRQSGYDHWYGERLIAAGAGNFASKTIELQVDSALTGEHMAQLEVALASNTIGQHHVKLLINDNPVAEQIWSHKDYEYIEAEFSQALLRPGENTLTVQLINDAPNQVVDILFVDWVRLDYARELKAISNALTFESGSLGAVTYSIAGLTQSDVELYDITDPWNLVSIQNAVANNVIQFTKAKAGVRHYVVLPASEWKSPLSIGKTSHTNLLSSSTGADYIVISHPDFMSAITPLLEYRSQLGMRTTSINVEDIYNQFNDGKPSPEAIRQFLAYAYNTWPAPAPAYVLLVGDGNYDPRQYLETSEPSFIPPFLEVVDKDLGETAADNRFVTFLGDDILPDMHIGRFPAKTAADVTAMVDKTIHYEMMTISEPWNERVLFVTDDLQGGGGAFYNFSDAIADGVVTVADNETLLLPQSYDRPKYYLGRENCPLTDAEQCGEDIVEEIESGALFVSYVGHGAKQYWAEEQLLTFNSLKRLENADRLPIMLPMTCLEGFFHEAQANSDAFGEVIVRQPENGAVASFSPTGFGLASGHDYLERGLFLAVFHHEVDRLGPATIFAKLYLMANAPENKYDDLIDTYLLFGDPALRVRDINSQATTIERQYEDIIFRTYLPTAGETRRSQESEN